MAARDYLKDYSQHNDLVKAPTSPMGAVSSTFSETQYKQAKTRTFVLGLPQRIHLVLYGPHDDGIQDLERPIRVRVCILHVLLLVALRRRIEHGAVAASVLPTHRPSAGAHNAPPPRERPEDRERVFVLARNVCVQEREQLGEERGEGQGVRVGRLGCEVPLDGREVEHDAQVAGLVHD